jgi:adenine phosphoribosyltransferase
MWHDSLWIKDKGWTSVRDYIVEVPDFPVKGISFKDISPLLADTGIFSGVIKNMGKLLSKLPDYWIGIEARGFLFASALSVIHGGGVVMCRKAGKLPPTVFSHSYETEYSEDTIQIKQGSGTVVIVDDVLATGGTLQAANYLAGTAGYDVIDNLVLIDLLYVTKIITMVGDGAKEFNLEVKSLIQYE